MGPKRLRTMTALIGVKLRQHVSYQSALQGCRSRRRAVSRRDVAPSRTGHGGLEIATVYEIKRLEAARHRGTPGPGMILAGGVHCVARAEVTPK